MKQSLTTRGRWCGAGQAEETTGRLSPRVVALPSSGKARRLSTDRVKPFERHGRKRQHLNMLIESLDRLAFPRACLGCATSDHLICPECWENICPPAEHIPPWTTLTLTPYDSAKTHDPTPHWAVGEYSGIVRNFLLAAKHRTDIKVLDELSECGYALGTAMGRSRMLELVVGGAENVWIIPAPSRLRRRWARRDVALPLAVGIACGISHELRIHTSVVEACALKWGAGTQAGKTGAARRNGRVGSMKARCTPPKDTPLIFVDDIVTTGATINEMARCMSAHPIAIASLARVTTRS